MTKINSSPNIRFRNFTNAWEQRKLGEVVDIRSGKDYKHLSKGNIPVYGTGGYMLSVDKALSYKEDSIGIGRKGTIDKPYILRAPFWTVDTLFYAVPETNNDLDFIYDIFQNINWRQKDESTGVPSLSKTAISDIDIFIPEYKEQQEIGTFFKNLDNLITLHQRKLEQLQLAKKTFLNKLLPKNKDKIPEIRFEEYSDEWELRRLEDLGEISTGNTPPTTNESYWSKQAIDDGHVWITPTDIDSLYIGDSERKLTDKGWSKARTVPINSVLITSIASIGKNAINTVPAAFNQQINAIVPKDNNSYFILYSMIRNSNRFASLAGQTATAIINKSTFEKFEIYVSNIEEQKQIGLLFKEIDNLITLHQRKLEILEKSKKYYLKHMFV